MFGQTRRRFLLAVWCLPILVQRSLGSEPRLTLKVDDDLVIVDGWILKKTDLSKAAIDDHGFR